MENITENNKLIAEFMGLSEIAKTNGIVFKDNNTDEIHLIKYNSDWNWLMPVIQKMTTTEEFQDKYEYNNLFWETFNQLDIDEIYTQVILFIEWYNENK